ncbi:MAG: 3-oxoacid CoA-transferase [Clostridiales bacterium]|jgi:propionate CoA-transferase|nr:3-oxoacid CoA-transferase [Clostridiales bacterium]
MAKIVSASEAIAQIKDGMTVGITSFATFGAAETLLKELAKSFQEKGSPRNLDLIVPTTPGDMSEDGWGLSALRAPGIIASIATSQISKAPAIARMVSENKIAGYIVPLGVFGHLFRAMAGKKPGIVTHVGLNTYADPRVEGCKVNGMAKESGRQIVSLIEIEGEEYLFYKSMPMDACIIRGTYADESGNITLEHETVVSEQFEMANAVHNNGGIVIAEVKDILERGSINCRDVKIHGLTVDYVVKSAPGDHVQTYFSDVFRPELLGMIRVPSRSIAPMEMSLRKIVARRAAMEIKKEKALVNLGLGISDGVPNIVNEEGFASQITLGVETGVMGGVPLSGLDMGTSVNMEALYKMVDTFDIYDGGMLDMSFLSFAQVDKEGNVNVSKFGSRVVGPGGFVNISQNTPTICFSAIFTFGHVDCGIGDGKLAIKHDGSGIKFVNKVDQITFSGKNAIKNGQDITFITERAVFKLSENGLVLIEIAPGVDLERDVLAKMEFRPLISDELRLMDERLFAEGPMGISIESNAARPSPRL